MYSLRFWPSRISLWCMNHENEPGSLSSSLEKNVNAVLLLEPTSLASSSRQYVAIGCIGYAPLEIFSVIAGASSQSKILRRLQSAAKPLSTFSRGVISEIHAGLSVSGWTMAPMMSSMPSAVSGISLILPLSFAKSSQPLA